MAENSYSLNYRIIDAHTHIMPWDQIKPENLAAFRRTHKNYAQIVDVTSHPDKLVRYMDRLNVEKLVLINYPSPEVIGFTAAANDFSANFARTHPDRFIPFGGVHPKFCDDVAAEMDRIIDLGIQGIKIHPPHQYIYPNAYHESDAWSGLATIYEKCQAVGLPVMIHTGTSVFPAARNKYCDPIYTDDLIVDFPKLKIILAHGGRPLWMDTAFFLVRRHPNVYMDISSIPPQNLLNYFPRLESIADKVLFGSDWPGPGVRDIGANIQSFLELPLSEETRRKILRDTALKLFGDST